MYPRLLLLLLLAVVSQRVHCQTDEAAPEVDDVEPELQLGAPGEETEGSGANPFGESAPDIPLIEDAETTTAYSSDDEIKCPVDICVCTHEQDDQGIKLTVDCSSKDLTELPSGIDTRVNRLLFQKNKLEEVPKEISKFQDLEELNVNDNAIKGFAFGSVSELPKLRVLKVANNRLLEFPQELKNGLDLNSLEQLDLGKNDMRDELTADLFTHMEKISVLTLPVSKPDLIVDLCHRLSATLQKVCTNDCNIDVEECANYAENSSDFLPVPSADMLENEADEDPEKDVVPEVPAESDISKLNNEVDDTLLDDSDNASEPMPEVNVAVPLDVPNITNNGTEQQSENTVAVSNEGSDIEVSTETLPVETLNGPVASTDTISAVTDGATLVDFSLRSAVNDAKDVADSTAQQPSGVSVLQAPVAVETQAKHEDMSDNVDTDTLGGNESAKQQSETDDTDVKVGAASVKQGGGIDNSVIALIVAGMVVVVAGVTIKKNWSGIKKRFSSRPSPAASVPTGANGTSPEEVPLQNKSMV